MKHFRELFIAVLILALFWAVFNDRVKAKKLAQYETKYKAKFDSLKELYHTADLDAIHWHTKYNVLEAGTKKQGDQLVKAIKENAYLKKTYAPLLPDSVIQREVATLYKGR